MSTIPKKIYIIGSGPAGLAAAHVLNARGFEVHVIERSNLIAGKVHSFDQDGRSHEHGVHGWWMNYLNFDRLLLENGIDGQSIFKVANGSTLLLPDKNRQPLKILKRNLPSPLFLIVQVLTSSLFRFKDIFSLVKFGILLFAFDHKRDYAYFDSYSFQALMDNCGVAKSFQSYMFEPFILSFDFTTSRRVSAACGLSGLQFYVIRDQRSILARWLKNTPEHCIFSPLRTSLERKGVTFHLNSKANKMFIKENAVENIVIDSSVSFVSSRNDQAKATIPRSLIPSNDFSFFEQHNIYAGKFTDEYRILSAKCSHQGCTVRWRLEQKIFQCPCHGGEYSPEGAVLSGPPPAPLAAPKFTIEGNNVVIENPVAVIDADQVIIATDVIAARDILRSSLPATHTLNSSLSRLDGTPVVVVRLWFDLPNIEPEIESGLTPEFTFIDNFFNLNSFSDSYDKQGHVIEVQSYRVFEHIDKNDQEILDIVLKDLGLINSGYIPSRLATFSIYKHRNLFTRYGPGLHQFRPSEKSGIKGLYFAGDWTSTEHSVWMMERAIVSGIRAANAICRNQNVSEYPILMLGKEHAILRLTRSVCRFSRRFILPTTLPKRNPKKVEKPSDRVITKVLHRKNPETGLYFDKHKGMTWLDWVTLLLHTAAEIEHALMNQYLYTAYSMNVNLGSAYYDNLKEWQNTISGIAVEEMGHFISVQNILLCIGAPINMDREDFPLRSEFYPFSFELLPFSKGVIAKYIIAEMPETITEETTSVLGEVIGDRTGFLNRVGSLYEDIITIFKDDSKIPDTVFNKKQIPVFQSEASDWKTRSSVLITKVETREQVLKVLNEIAEQGEGNQDSATSHFASFLNIYREYDIVDPNAVNSLSYLVPDNPKTISSRDGDEGIITHPVTLLWNEAFNNCYRQILNFISHTLTVQLSYYSPPIQTQIKNILIEQSTSLMRGKGFSEGGLKSLAQKIFTLPLKSNSLGNVNAGPTFEMPFTLNFPANEDAKWKSHIQLAEKQLALVKEIETIEAASTLTRSVKSINQHIYTACNECLSQLILKTT